MIDAPALATEQDMELSIAPPDADLREFVQALTERLVAGPELRYRISDRSMPVA